jgi:hypothetical protein
MKNSIKMHGHRFVPMAVILLLTACHVEVNPDPAKSFQDGSQVLQYIKDLGFAEKDIVEHDDYYEVEGDIMFSKNGNPNARVPNNGRTGQAYVTSGLVGYSEIVDVTVTVHSSIPSSGVDDWRTEVEQAVNDWNSIGNTRVNLVYTTNATADILVRDDAVGDPLGNNTIAQAEFPSSGAAGFQIRINLDFLSNMTVSTGQKRYNMVHELGHCIGFRHTNWTQFSPDNTIPANHLPGTPCLDANSVMNSGTALNSWAGFSDYDVVGCQVLYPIDRPAGTYYFLRYYQGSSGDHFYTIYFGELACGASGYVAEGYEGYIFQNQASGTTPIYRYYNSSLQDHFYTTTSGSYSGYVSEGISGYAYSTPVAGTMPIYVYYNSSLGDHFYTRFNGSYAGYTSQGIAWYAIP